MSRFKHVADIDPQSAPAQPQQNYSYSSGQYTSSTPNQPQMGISAEDAKLMEMQRTWPQIFPKAIVGGGTGIYYSADNIWILGRQQDKKGTEVQGYHFVINVEKSRYVKEKSKIPITVSWDGGVRSYSGLLDVALAGGYVTKPSNGWYATVDMETGEIGQKVRHDFTLEKEFWEPIFANTDFKEFVKKQYTIGHKDQVSMDEIVEEA